MKTYLFLFLLVLPFSCFSQNWADNNAVWHYSQTMYMPPFTHPFIKFSVTGDTVINGEQTKILKEEKVSISDTAYSQLYMKSDSDRVYVFAPELNSFQLVYDFNAMPGDTVHVFCRVPKDPWGNDTITIVVDSLSTLVVNGKGLKVQHIRQVRSPDDKYNMNGEIIENIGWTGFMFPLHAWADPPYGGSLRCFQNDSIHIKRSVVDCDFTGYMKSNLLVQSKKWIFLVAHDYPNPEIYTDWRYKIGNDTIVDGIQYKNLLSAQGNDRYTGIRGFIREEDNGKVYFKYNSELEENEILLYDFGMEVGDTARLGYSNSFHRLDSTGRNIDGKKVYYFTESQLGNDVWIEGVGSTRGLLKEQITGGSMLFSCCLLGGEYLYHNPKFEGCYFEETDSLVADAGNDVIVCTGENSGEYKLGGCPAAKGGVPPYTFTWSGKFYGFKYPEGGPFWIYASDVLNDTTQSNPLIKMNRNVNDEWTTYYLKVQDAEGTVSYDSVQIIASHFLFGGPYMIPDTIYRGDSVQFFGSIPILGSNFEPMTEYLFTPSHGLRDSTDIYTWAKPDTSTTYFIQATNSVGCISNRIEYWHIEVIDTTGVSSKRVAQAETKCFFSGNGLTVERKNDLPWRLIVTTLTGKVLHTGEYTERYLHLKGLGLKPQAIYLVTVSDNKTRKTFKLFNY